MVRYTSIKAYYEEIPKLSTKRRKILRAFVDGDMSNREASLLLNIPINQVTGRVLELRQMGLLVEKGREIDQMTKKLVTIWGLSLDNGQL